MLALDGFVHGLHTLALISNGHGGYESPSHFSTNLMHALAGIDATSIPFWLKATCSQVWPRPLLGESLSS